MTAKELTAALQITNRELVDFIRAGLPHGRKGNARTFDPQRVRDWMVAKGYARNTEVVRTAGEVAQHFHVGERAVRSWLAAGCPGAPGQYDLPAIAAWRAARNATDPMLVGDSPMLEKYRREKWKLARLERLEREGKLIDAEFLRTVLMRMALRLRQVGDTLERHHGQEAARVLRDGLTDCKREVDAAAAEVTRRRPATRRGTNGDPTDPPAARS